MAGLTYFALARPLTVAPRLGAAPAYSLVGEDGRPVTHETFAGQPVLYSFFSTQDGDRLGAAMAQALRRLQDRPELPLGEPGPLRFVTISTAPELDTPDRLQAAALRYGARPDRWRFLTGPALAVKIVVGTGFGVYYAANPSLVHDRVPVYDSRYVLVDGRGWIRGAYSGPDLDVARLARDLALVEQESRALGVTRIAYEAAHLFLCYPR